MVKINIPSVNDRLLDKYIRHSVWMEQLKAGEAAAISKMLKKDVFPQLYDKLINELGKVKNLKTVGSIRKIKRIKQMMASVEQTATAGAIKAGKLINKKMYDVARFEAVWNRTVLEKTVPLDISLNVPSNAVLKQLVLSSTFEGHRMQTWMKGYSRSVQAGIVKQLKAGVATGESLPAIATRLRKVLGQKSRQAETLARTAVSNIVHDAREATFIANKKLIRKVQIIATLDDKTTLICINLDGKVFNVGEGDRPPFHFNCRSTSVPVVTSWNEFGVTDPPAFTRASMNGAVPAKMNYRQWLKKQSKATQIKVLGKKRQALYASGKVKIDRFVSKDFKPLSLKQLARREGLALKKVTKVRAKVIGPSPAPPSVNTIPLKKNGINLTTTEVKMLEDYSWERNSHNVVRAQLGRPSEYARKDWNFAGKKEALLQADKIETALKKMDGFDGKTYRGLNFNTPKQRQTFLDQFQDGTIWKSKSFQSTSKSKRVAEDFMEAADFSMSENSVLMHIEGKSGRDLTNRMKEVLFMKDTPFKVIKIKGDEIWLKEVTDVSVKLTKAAKAEVIVSTTSKVGATFAKDTTRKFQDIVSKQIDSYPEKVKAALNKKGASYQAGRKITDMRPDLKGLQPRGWSSESTWDAVDGLFDTRTKTITISETHQPVGSKSFIKISKNRTKGVLNHETGHAFDSAFDGVDYSQQLGFKNAWRKDIVAMGGENVAKKKGLRYYVAKGKQGSSETFAEVFADIMGGGSNAFGKAGVSKYFPNSRKYIEGVLRTKTSTTTRAVTKVKATITKPISSLMKTRLAKPKVQSLIESYNRVCVKPTENLFQLKTIQKRLAENNLWIDDTGRLVTDSKLASTNKSKFPKIEL